MMRYKHRQGLSCYSFPIRLDYLFISNSTTRTKKISVNSSHVNPCSQTLTPGKRSKTRNRSKNPARLKTASVNSCITVLGSCQVIFVASFIHIFLLCFHDSHFHFLLSVIYFSLDVALMIFLQPVFVLSSWILHLCQLSLFYRAFKALLFSPFKLNSGSFSPLVWIVAAEVNTVIASAGAPLCRESHHYLI